MHGEASCPRCGGPVQPPGLWSSDWSCPVHGAVLPMQPVSQPRIETVLRAAASAKVPAWLPWPLPHGWVVSGLAHAGDDRTGSRATAVACTGPAPLGGPGDLVIIAEEPGVGLGARYAGLPGPDPGAAPDRTPPHARVRVSGHDMPLWLVPDVPDDRCAYVGEALGNWLWMVLWPATAGVLLMEHIALVDLGDPGHLLDFPVGALSERLLETPTGRGRGKSPGR